MLNSDDARSTNGNEPFSDCVYKFIQNEIKFDRLRKQDVFSWASRS